MKKLFSAMAFTAIGFSSLYAQSTTVSGTIYNQPQAGVALQTGANATMPNEKLAVALIRSVADTIVASQLLLTGNTFSFTGIQPGNYYAMVITPDIPTLVGNAAPPSILQTDWTRMGESVDASGTPDATIDGKTAVFTVAPSTPFNTIRFGLQSRPTAHNKRNVQLDKNATSTTTTLSVNTTAPAFTQGGTAILSGVDYHTGTVTSYTINNLPKFGTLYLGSTAVSNISAVTNLTAAQVLTLGYRPNATAKPQEMDFFTYYVNDNANTKSSPATYVIPFQLLDADGDGVPDRTDVDDDNDGITDVTECNLNSLSALTVAYQSVPSQFTTIKPSHFAGYSAAAPFTHTKGVNLTADLSAAFGKPANSGAIIVTITNANTHPTADVFYSNDSTGPSVWTVTGTLGSYVVMNQGAEYFSWDTRSITRLDNGVPFQIFAQQGVDPSATTYWLPNNDTYTWSLKSDTALRGPNPVPGPRIGYLLGGFTDPSPKYFQMASNANNRDEWATYTIEILPECDFDNDGIPNRLDLDSDNDGCLDAVEGGASININGTIVAPVGTLTSGPGSSAPNRTLCVSSTCVNPNGLPNVVSATSGQTAGSTYNASAQDADCTVPLPVGLLQFNAFKNAAAVKLEWITANEINNKGFNIERSADGKSWATIGFLNSLSENGNSNANLNYQFIDDKPFTGSNLYRLKQIDFDGNYNYSETRTINMTGDGAIHIFPNPVVDQVNITGLSTSATILVYSLDGKRMIQQKTTGNNVTVSMAGLSEGLYTIIIQGNNGSILSRQNIVKKK